MLPVAAEDAVLDIVEGEDVAADGIPEHIVKGYGGRYRWVCARYAVEEAARDGNAGAQQFSMNNEAVVPEDAASGQRQRCQLCWGG